MKKHIALLLCLVVVSSLFIAGCAKKQKEEEVIKIGAILPLTRHAQNLGQNSRAAMELALEEINKKGGINGKRLEIIFEDGVCNGKDAVTAANKLISIDKVPIIIGGLCSSETLAVAPIAENTKTVLLSPCSSNPSITNAGDYVFRIYPSDSFQGKYAAEFAYNKLGARKAAIIYILSDWGEGIQKVFENRFKELGGEVVIKESFEPGAKDMKTQLTKIKYKKPDVLLFLSYPEEAVVGLKQIKEVGIDTKILGADGWGDPKIWKEVGEAGENAMYVMPFSPLTEDFKAKMKAKTNSDEITICTPNAYDAVFLVADILRKVGTNSEAIKNELYRVKDYQGVSGIITLDENGDLSSASYVTKIIRNGKEEIME